MNGLIDRLVWNDGLSDYEDLTIEMGAYRNGTIALQLIGDMGPIVTVTTNLQAYGILPEPDCFFIKNYSESKGLGHALEMAGVVERTERKTVFFGPHDASANEYRLTNHYKKEIY